MENERGMHDGDSFEACMTERAGWYLYSDGRGLAATQGLGITGARDHRVILPHYHINRLTENLGNHLVSSTNGTNEEIVLLPGMRHIWVVNCI